MRLAALALALWLAAGGASAGPSYVGSWFGQGEPDDSREYWLGRLGADGSFRLHTRSCAHGKPLDHFEQGRWTLDKSGMVITTTSADDGSVNYADSYTTLAYDGSVWRYRLGDSNFSRSYIGFEFTSRRVGDDFELPECGPEISLLPAYGRRA
jgi:hypothetical protein